MKTLLLMRHAKSSWKQPDLPDNERPLTKRGVRASVHMGELLRAKGLLPQMILSSTAVRAEQTAKHLCKGIGCSDHVSSTDDLYLAEAETYINRLHHLSDELERVMIVGHNPGLESLLQLFSGQIETLPTAAIAHLSFPVDSWKDLHSDTQGTLVDLWKPKEIPDDFLEIEEERKTHSDRKKGEDEKRKK